MTVKELAHEHAGVTFIYKTEDTGIWITGIEGKRSELFIPSEIDGQAVVGIEKKAFFNVAGVSRIIIPETVNTLGDWAFSHCKDLEEVFLKRKAYDFGRAVFAECPKLKRICISDLRNVTEGSVTDESAIGNGLDDKRDEEKEQPDNADILGFGSLLAATCGILDASYLFQTDIKDQQEWLTLWDAKMFSILREDDMEGYTQVLLCGEEDYGSKENNIDFYLSEKRKRKVRLAFLRLLYNNGLKDDAREELEQYLLNHAVGCESTETWQVLRDEYADDVAYINLFLDIGCVNDVNFDFMLKDLSAEHPQLKTYLLRYKEENMGGSDFFAGLSLDL